MDDPSNVQPVSDEKRPQRESAGDFVVPTERTEDSLLLSAPELTPLQQRKKDAQELAELIYKIYNENCPVLTNKEDGNA